MRGPCTSVTPATTGRATEMETCTALLKQTTLVIVQSQVRTAIYPERPRHRLTRERERGSYDDDGMPRPSRHGFRRTATTSALLGRHLTSHLPRPRTTHAHTCADACA